MAKKKNAKNDDDDAQKKEKTKKGTPSKPSRKSKTKPFNETESPKKDSPKNKKPKKKMAASRKANKRKQQTKASKEPPYPVNRTDPNDESSFEMEEAVTSDNENDPIVTDEDDDKRWRKAELLIVGKTVRFVKSNQRAKTELAGTLRKWREAQKALFKRGYKRSLRAISQKWRRMISDWRQMDDKSNGRVASGGNRKGVDYRFLADYQEYISPLTEASKPTFVIGTQPKKKPGFIAPLKLNSSVAPPPESDTMPRWNKYKSSFGDLEKELDSEDIVGETGQEYEDYDEFLDPVFEATESGNESEDSNDDLPTNSTNTRDGIPHRVMDEDQDPQSISSVTQILIDSPSPLEPANESPPVANIIQDTYRMSRFTAKVRAKTTGIKSHVKKGRMMALRRNRVYGDNELPRMGPDELVPVIVIGSRRENLMQVSTLDLELVPDIPKNDFDGLVLNPEDFLPNDCTQQRLDYLEKVFLREGSEEDHPDIKRLGPELAKKVEYFVLGGFGDSAVLGRKAPGKDTGDVYKTIIRRKAQEFISTRNRIPVRLSMPANIDIRPRNYSAEDLHDLRSKIARGKPATDKKEPIFGDGLETKDKVFFCVVDQLVEGVGPIMLGNDGSKTSLNDLPHRGNNTIISPGEQTSKGADDVEILRGDSVHFTKEGNVEDFGTVINIVSDWILIQSHREGAHARYEVALNKQCRQMNEVIRENFSELREAKRRRREEDREPVFVHPRPRLVFATPEDEVSDASDGETETQTAEQSEVEPGRSMEDSAEADAGEDAGDRIDDLMDEILGRKKKTDGQRKGKREKKDKDKKQSKSKKKKMRRRDDDSDEDDDAEKRLAKRTAKEIASVLLPGFQDIFTGYWRDKRNYATETRNRDQMHATTQIQSAMQFSIESKRAEAARQERLLVELMRMGAARHEAMLKMLGLMTQFFMNNASCNQEHNQTAGTQKETTHLDRLLDQINVSTKEGRGNCEPRRQIDEDSGPPNKEKDKEKTSAADKNAEKSSPPQPPSPASGSGTKL